METNAVNQKRLPRFRRLPGQFKIRLTERDLEILGLVYDYRFASSAHIRALIPGSDKWITERLQKLFHEGYLDRPREQGAHAFGKTNFFVYGLGREGARALAEARGIDFKKIEWTAKNREAKQRYIWHTLMIANFRATLTLALKNKPGFKLMFWKQDSELKDKFTVSGEGSRQSWFVVFPDALFALEDKEGKKRYFCLEADRSTMQGTRYLRKLRGYWHFWQKRRHKSIYGIGNFRVLTLTMSERRAQNLRKVAKLADDERRGSGMFWFSCEKRFDLAKPGGILAPVWESPADSKNHHLLEAGKRA